MIHFQPMMIMPKNDSREVNALESLVECTRCSLSLRLREYSGNAPESLIECTRYSLSLGLRVQSIDVVVGGLAVLLLLYTRSKWVVGESEA